MTNSVMDQQDHFLADLEAEKARVGKADSEALMADFALLQAENKELKAKLKDIEPKYEELLEFACERMYNFNSGIWPDDMNMDKLTEQ